MNKVITRIIGALLIVIGMFVWSQTVHGQIFPIVQQVRVNAVQIIYDIPLDVNRVIYYKVRGADVYQVFQDDLSFVVNPIIPDVLGPPPYDQKWSHLTGDTYIVEIVHADGVVTRFGPIAAMPMPTATPTSTSTPRPTNTPRPTATRTLTPTPHRVMLPQVLKGAP